MKKKVGVIGICLLVILLLSTFVIALKPEEGSVFAEPVLADGQKHSTIIRGEVGSVPPGADVVATSTTDGNSYESKARSDGSFEIRVFSYADEYFEVEYEGGRILLPKSVDPGMIGFQNAVDFGFLTSRNYVYALTHPKQGEKINFANMGPMIGLFSSAVQVGSEVGKFVFKAEIVELAGEPDEKEDKPKDLPVEEKKEQVKKDDCECTGEGKIYVNCDQWDAESLRSDLEYSGIGNIYTKYFFGEGGMEGDYKALTKGDDVYSAECKIKVKSCPESGPPCKVDDCKKACEQDIKNKLEECGNSYKKYCKSGFNLGDSKVDDPEGKCVEKCVKLKKEEERGDIGVRPKTELKIPVRKDAPKPNRTEEGTEESCLCDYYATKIFYCEGELRDDEIPEIYKGTQTEYPMEEIKGGSVQIVNRWFPEEKEQESIADRPADYFWILSKSWIVCKLYAEYGEPGCDMEKCEEHFRGQLKANEDFKNSQSGFFEQCKKEAEMVCNGEIKRTPYTPSDSGRGYTGRGGLYAPTSENVPLEREIIDCECIVSKLPWE
ncbi:hypothetical protein KY336_03745 [Candidatus Woesearchaeota archaeon]|nr:hypothetical protein [Candidatus Woesearchaeota archaeon]